MFVRFVLGFTILLCCHGMLFAETYRWVDDQGNVIYSQTPPRDDRDVTSIKPPPPPATPPEQQRQSWEERDRAYQERREARQEEAAKAEEERMAAQELEQQCRDVRNNMTMLENRPPNTLYRTDSGEYKRYTVEEREDKLNRYQKFLSENCD